MRHTGVDVHTVAHKIGFVHGHFAQNDFFGRLQNRRIGKGRQGRHLQHFGLFTVMDNLFHRMAYALIKALDVRGDTQSIGVPGEKLVTITTHTVAQVLQACLSQPFSRTITRTITMKRVNGNRMGVVWPCALKEEACGDGFRQE